MAKKNSWKIVWMILYWAVFLTATATLFEYVNVIPGAIPFGIVGWFVLVEVPRVIFGVLLSMLFFKQ